MPLSAGSQIGPYRIVMMLGSGGMGEVYRARDTRLNRDVAVKILPLSFAQDSVRLHRFEQEAQAAGALNHPNIVAVYDTGVHEGMPYLVTELLEGESLRQRLETTGKLSVPKVLDYAMQIASGLSAAHAMKVTHRDIKPDNLFLTRDGRVKILDFGLAKQASPAPQPDEPTRKLVSEAGTVVGTVGYLSPEQIRGQAADARSDLFSLGVVMHEMLTGQRAFARETSVESMNDILKEELPETGNAAIDAVLRHCLEKDPDLRFQTAQDLSFALRQLNSSGSGTRTAQVTPRVKKPWRFGVPMAAALLGSAFTFWLLDQPQVDLSTLRFTPMTQDVWNANQASWAPDGQGFAFFSVGKGILLRSLEADMSVLLAPINMNIMPPLYSRSGTHLYYVLPGVGNRTLWSLSLASGRQEQLLAAPIQGYPSLEGFAEAPDGKSLIVAQHHQGSLYGLWSSSPPGSPLVRLPYPEFEVGNRVFLRFSPDGRRLLLMSLTDVKGRIWVFPWPAKHEARLLLEQEQDTDRFDLAQWMEDGKHILVRLGAAPYMVNADSGARYPLGDGLSLTLSNLSSSSQGRFLAGSGMGAHVMVELPFDGGRPKPVLQDRLGGAYPSWSANGSQMVYVAGNAIWLYTPGQDQRRRILKQVPTQRPRRMRFANPSFSPDGRRIVFSETDSIWTMPVSGGTAARITSGLNPSWSPDGEWLAYRMREGTKSYLAKIRLGATPQPVKLHETTAATPPAWSPDGRWLALAVPEGLAVVSPAGKEKRLLLARTLDNYSPVVWSRDGKTVYMTELSTRGVFFESKLSEIDFATGRERLIAVYPDTRLDTVQMNSNKPSLTPDGKGLVTTMFRYDSTIYMIEGLQPPRTRLERWLARTPLY